MGLRVEDYSSVGEALSGVKDKLRIRRLAQALPTEDAHGRVSSSDVVAPLDVPPFPTSHMDGFAVRAGDLESASEEKPLALKIRGEVKLGVPSKLTVRHREAVWVATGARVPGGADAIIPAEFAKQRGGQVLVSSRLEAGSHVYKKGEDVREGEVVLAQGQVVRAQDIGLLLAIGVTRVRVWARPKVSVIATGNELTDAARPRAGKVRNSHSPVFVRLVGALGGIPVDLGIAKDDREQIAGKIRRALVGSDFVLTLGGTSAGKHDVVGEAVSGLRPDVVFHGIRMDRGRVTGIAVVQGKPVLMMPGPIQAAMNAFVLFGVPVINLLSGRDGGALEVVGRMGNDWETRKRFPNFRKVVYVKLRGGEEKIAEPLAGETESMKVLVAADGYVVVPEGVTRIPEGSRVRVNLLPGFSFA